MDFLVRAILHKIRSALPEERYGHLEKALPHDWRNLLEAA